MKIYHASASRIEHPDIAHSRSNLDFGRGFYTTTLKKQAADYAMRFRKRDHKAYVNTYDLYTDGLKDFNVLEFEAYDEKWLEFVLGCRNGRDSHEWDVVIGGIADDRVFTTVDLYFAGLITVEEALGRLAFIKPNDQICFCTQEAIDKLLAFSEAEEVA